MCNIDLKSSKIYGPYEYDFIISSLYHHISTNIFDIDDDLIQ